MESLAPSFFIKMTIPLTQKQKIIRILWVLPFPLVFGLFYFLSTHLVPPDPSAALTTEGDSDLKRGILSSVTSERFTEEEYDQERARLQNIVLEQDPRAALQELKKIAEQARGRSDCHRLTHEVGRAAFLKYRNLVKTFVYREQVCGFGYVHGVLSEYVKSAPNSLKAIETTCQNYSERREELECYHAMGHALMIQSGNNLPQSIKMCEKYTGDIERASCGLGVFMENFSSDDDHPSQYLAKDDSFYPCNEQTELHKPGCYKMIPLHYLRKHGDDYSGILRWCLSAEQRYQPWCTRGVALEVVQFLPMYEMEQVCYAGNDSQVAPCIQEIVRKQLVNMTREEVKVSCSRDFLSEASRVICLKAAEIESKF